MQLTVLTPQKKVLVKEEIEELFAPGQAGTLNILPEHAALVTELETGVLQWRKGRDTHKAAISRGFLEVKNDQVTVLAEVLELADNIDKERAKQALQRAQTKLGEGGLDDANFRKYELKLRRAMTRADVAQ